MFSLFSRVRFVAAGVAMLLPGLLGVLVPVQAQGGMTAILLVDDFSGKQDSIRQFIRSELDSGMLPDQIATVHGGSILAMVNAIDAGLGAGDVSFPNDHCVVTNDGQAVQSMGMAVQSMGMGDPFAQLRQQGEYHGHLVQAQTFDALGIVGGGAAVIPVDIPGFALDLVAPAISREVAMALSTFENVVVNLSFGIVPCGDVADVFAYEEAIVDDPNMALQYRNEIALTIQHANATNPPPLPHFIDYLPDLYSVPAGRNLAFVGAAGNVGLPFPMYPALFADVIAVSAGEASGSEFYAPLPQDFSNSGEFMLPGTYFYAGNEIHGTSFAAPRLSALLSVLFTQHGHYMETTCFTGLSYAPFSQPNTFDNPNLDDLLQSNMTPCEGIADPLRNLGLVP